MVVIDALVIVLVVCGGACAALKDNAACYDAHGHTEYVNDSLKMVEQGTPSGQVLDTLYCVWRNDAVKSKVRSAAFRAFVHLARDHRATLRKYLVAVIEENSETDRPCPSDVCEVLMFVADAASRDLLLAEVKKHWGTAKAAECYFVLRELGDEGLIAWLEEKMEAVPVDRRDRWPYAEDLRFAKSLRSLEGVLTYLRTERIGVGVGEVIQQAIRHGASRDDLRRYYLEGIAEYDGTTRRSRLRARRYAEAARDRGIFDKSDIEKLPEALKVSPERFEDDLDYGHVWPSWATGIDELRRAFWGPYRLDGKEKQSCDK